MKNLLILLVITVCMVACLPDVDNTILDLNREITNQNDSITRLINIESDNELNIERNNIVKLINQVKTIMLMEADSKAKTIYELDNTSNTDIPAEYMVKKGYGKTVRESIQSYQIAICNDLGQDTIGFNKILYSFPPIIDANNEQKPWEYDFYNIPICATFLMLSKLERDINILYLLYIRKQTPNPDKD